MAHGSSQEQLSRQFWDRSAVDGFEDFPGLLGTDLRLARYRDTAEKAALLARHGQRLRGRRVLEVGCGGGRWSPWLAARFDQVIATDISAEMVERARRRCAAHGAMNVELFAAPLERLPPLAPFDVVYLGGCLQYISDEDVEQIIPAVARLVMPGGTLLTRDSVSTVGRTFRRREYYEHDHDDPSIYRPLAWYRERFEGNALRLIDEWPTYVLPLAWKLRAVLPEALVTRGMEAELPYAAAAVRAFRLLHKPGPKDHRFFVYARA